MTRARELKPSHSPGVRHFQKFTFINDSTLDSASGWSKKLDLDPNSKLLSQTQIGSWLTINQIQVPPRIIRQLRNLQFKPNQRVQLVSKTNRLSVVVNLNDTLIGIGAKIAQKIVVTLVDETKS